jgi:hypothetical protein
MSCTQKEARQAETGGKKLFRKDMVTTDFATLDLKEAGVQDEVLLETGPRHLVDTSDLKEQLILSRSH